MMFYTSGALGTGLQTKGVFTKSFLALSVRDSWIQPSQNLDLIENSVETILIPNVISGSCTGREAP